MSSLIEGIKAKAKANKQHILLPEGEEERTVQAAAIIKEQGLADVTLFGKPERSPPSPPSTTRISPASTSSILRTMSSIPPTWRSSTRCAS